MIGEIKEKTVGRPKPLPLAMKTLVPSVLPSVLPPGPAKFQSTQATLGRKPFDSFSKVSAATTDENTQIIEKMSSEELQAALEEVSSLLSAKNIAFLRSKGKSVLTEESSSSSASLERPMTEGKDAISPSLIPKALKFNELSNDSADEIKDEEQLTDSSPRFDLQGRRVIVEDTLIAEISSILGSFFEEYNHLVSLQQVSTQIAGGVIAAGVCFKYVSRDDPEAADLFNHEFSPESPGYNLREICELFRSEYPLQRSLAVKMLQGILQIRDCIVSLTPYSTSEGSALHYRSGVSGCSQFNALCSHLKNPLNTLSMMKFKGNNTLMSTSSGAADRICLASTVLVNVLLRLCSAEKLPPSLPSLLLWSLQMRSAGPLLLSCLLATQHYLSSGVETAVRASAADWKGLWGSYGAPPLLTPHNKRNGSSAGDVVTYEKHLMECLEKSQPARKEKESGESEDETSTNNDEIHTAFVLKCRWNRVEAFFGEASFTTKILGLAIQHTEQLLRKLKSSKSDSVVITIEGVQYSSGLVCLDLLYLVPSALAGSGNNESILTSLGHKIVKSLLPLFVELEGVALTLWALPNEQRFNGSSKSAGLFGVCGDYLVSWWRLLCEFSRWSSHFTQSLFGSSQRQQHSFVFTHLTEWIVGLSTQTAAMVPFSPPSHLVWCLRLTRLCLIQDGVGLNSGLLIAVLSSKWMTSVVTAAGDVSGDQQLFRYEGLAWLEQCTVTVSQWIINLLHEKNRRSNHSSSKEISLPLLKSVCELLLSHFEAIVEQMSASFLSVDLTSSEVEHLSSSLHFLLSIVGGRMQHLSNNTCNANSTEIMFVTAVGHMELRGVALIPALASLSKASGGAALVIVDWRASLSKGQQLFSPQLAEKLNQWLMKASHESPRSAEGLQKAELCLAIERLAFSPLVSQFPIGETVKWSDMLPSVTSTLPSGLFAWQLSRLHQASLLLQLQHTAASNPQLLIPQFLSFVGSFTDSLSGVASYLLNAYLYCVLVDTNRSGDNSVLLTQQLDDLRASLLSAITGVALPSPQFATLLTSAPLRLGAYGALQGQLVQSSHSFPCHWLLNCFTGHFPLPSHWQFSCLPHLSGAALIHWMQHLLRTIQSSVAPVRSGLDTAVYYLLKLAAEENVANWNVESDVGSSSSSGVADVSDSAAQVYSSLLRCLIIQATVSNSYETPTGVAEAFVAQLSAIAKLNHFSAPSLNAGRTVKPSAASSLAGLLDLTSKLCDSAMSQAVHSEVHCASLCVLLLPAMPLLIRSKIWRQLSELRLLHLLESETVWSDKDFTNLFDCLHTSNNVRDVECMRLMLAGLCTLRGAEDYHWRVVSVMVRQISQCLFSGPPEMQSEEPRTSLLLEVVRNELSDGSGQRLSVPDWLVKDILAYLSTKRFCGADFHDFRVLQNDSATSVDVSNSGIEIVFASGRSSLLSLIKDHRPALLR